MHKNVAFPSTYYQYVKYPLRGGQGTIAAENEPFLSVEAYHAKAQLTRLRVDMAGDEDVLVTVSIRHPIEGFTRLFTIGMRNVKLYHCFKVHKKG